MTNQAVPTSYNKRTRLDPRKRKAQLLEYALAVFARRGIGRGGHAEIASDARVSVATVFNYFNTREALVEAVISEVERFHLELTREIFQKHTDTGKAMLEHASAFSELKDSNPDYIKIWLDWSTSIDSPWWESYLKFQRQIIGTIADHIRQSDSGSAANPEASARCYIGYAHMAVMMMYDPDLEVSRQQLGQSLIRHALEMGKDLST